MEKLRLRIKRKFIAKQVLILIITLFFAIKVIPALKAEINAKDYFAVFNFITAYILSIEMVLIFFQESPFEREVRTRSSDYGPKD